MEKEKPECIEFSKHHATFFLTTTNLNLLDTPLKQDSGDVTQTRVTARFVALPYQIITKQALVVDYAHLKLLLS